MSKKKKILFIEGTSDKSNGDLSQGFYKLLRQELEGNMPKIAMANGKMHAIKKFKNSKSAFSFLLIDLDVSEELKEEQIMEMGLQKQEDWVFFMVQEIEAWFMSQPNILDDYYHIDISSKLKGKQPKKIKKPSEELKNLTKHLPKKTYHKVRHAADLLQRLNAQKLRIDFKEFDRLIEKILNPTDKK
ncbi:MAG: DUF4276 family protein [Bacteroidota bacterium]